MDLPDQLQSALGSTYALERELGRGGMATVYLARDLRHERPVALKVLHPELAAVIGAERFLAEIRVTANLQHPHILPLFDSGRAEGALYYVMPYVRGESLRARLARETQLPVDEAVRITREVAAALDYAHRQGVVHRDIKPENILLQEGTALVADFGIALAVTNAGGHRMTQTGLSLGTPNYMSPEQATGNREIDGRSDQYSLACVLYEMLAGEPPFTGPNSQAVVAKVLTEPAPAVTGARPATPAPVAAALQRALQKLPADRFAGVAQFVAALEAAGGATVATSIVSPIGRVVDHRGVRRWQAATVVACLVAGIAGWRALQPQRSDTLQLARQLTFDGTVQAAAISPDGQWLAYIADECAAADFESCAPALQVREVDGTQSVRLLSWFRMAPDLKWSEDGSRILLRGSPDSSTSGVYVVSRLGGSLHRIAASATAMDFTPDGQAIALAVGQGARQWLVRYDARSLARVDSAPLPASLAFTDLEYGPRGDRIAFSADVGELRVVLGLLGTDGEVVDSVTVNARRTIRWNSRGTGLLAFELGPGISDNLIRFPVARGSLASRTPSTVLGQVSTGYAGRFDAAREGRLAIVASPTTHTLSVAELDGAEPRWTSLTTRTGYVEHPEFSADGSQLAVVATDNLGDNVYRFPMAGGPPTAVTALRGARTEPRWSPDGRRLAYQRYPAGPGPPSVAFIDVGGGRERELVAETLAGGMMEWLADDAIVLVRADSIVVLDTLGKATLSLALPDSLGSPGLGVALDRGTARLAYWSLTAKAVIVADLRARRFAVLMKSAEVVIPLGWGTDRALLAGLRRRGPGRRGQEPRQIVRISPEGRVVKVIAPIDVTCNGFDLSPNGRMAACTAQLVKPDVWLADAPGRSGW